MNRYIRYEVVPIPGFLKDIIDNRHNQDIRIQVSSGKWVGCTSNRLRTFAKGIDSDGKIRCVSCGIEATHFAVEASPNQSNPHMNLYGMRDGGEVLFTHDHILARGLGGADNLSNTQVMCSPCNSKKSIEEGKEAVRRRKAKIKAKNEKTSLGM